MNRLPLKVVDTFSAMYRKMVKAMAVQAGPMNVHDVAPRVVRVIQRVYDPIDLRAHVRLHNRLKHRHYYTS